uniref:FAS1 domain-containing protein n=1 Tax=Setaria italica TaxID=4555 RepID=K3YYU1_SETIT
MACFKAAAMSLVVVVILAISAVVSAEAAAVVDAPSPAPPVPLNLTEILTKDTQYNAIIRLLKDTEVTSQVTSLIGSDRNADGLDCAGPDRRGVCGAPAQSQLVLFHILPWYYSLVSFQTTTNPLRTQASGQHGVCTVNVTSGGERQVNVSTLGKPLYSVYPGWPCTPSTSAVKDGAEAPAPAVGKRQEQAPSSTVADQAPADEKADDEAAGTATKRTRC